MFEQMIDNSKSTIRELTLDEKEAVSGGDGGGGGGTGCPPGVACITTDDSAADGW